MSQILLIDFSEKDAQEIKSEGFDVELKNTNWVSGETEPLIPLEDSKIIFYNADDSDPASSLHSEDTKYFMTLVSAGSIMVCFVGETRASHITNLTGLSFSEENFYRLDNPSQIEAGKDSLFTAIFSRLGGHITYSARLWKLHRNLSNKIDLEQNDIQAIAVHKESGATVAAYKKHKKGFFLLLPCFGDGELNIEVVQLLLKKILPTIRPDLFEDKENKWLQDSRYYIPSLLSLNNKRKSIEEEYSLKIEEVDKEIKKIQKEEQDILNKLLISKGEELKRAVIHWLKYIGFTAVDVDEYWKKDSLSHQKEEDIWLYNKKNPNILEDELILVEVKSSKRGASDDDIGTIQKYKGRRMQEYGHTNMKGLLVGNYFCNNPAHLRKDPFSNHQIKDTKRDNNALLTTYDLFEAIKKEKSRELSKKDIQLKIRNTNGVIKWSKLNTKS